MAKLSTTKRASLGDDEFAGPDRTFPIENDDHAEAAILDAPAAEAAGSITANERSTIDKKAHAKLDKHPTRVAIRKASAAVGARK